MKGCRLLPVKQEGHMALDRSSDLKTACRSNGVMACESIKDVIFFFFFFFVILTKHQKKICEAPAGKEDRGKRQQRKQGKKTMWSTSREKGLLSIFVWRQFC